MAISPTALVVVDTETTGLDDQLHEVFEIAAIRRNSDGTQTRLEFWLPVDLERADPRALELNRYHERLSARQERGLSFDDPAHAVAELVELTRGLPILGMNPGFDVRFLTPLILRHGRRPEWHYTPVDVKALIAGALRIPPPWRSEELARALRIDPADYARHGAMGDCEYTLDCYDAVMALPLGERPLPIAAPA